MTAQKQNGTDALPGRAEGALAGAAAALAAWGAGEASAAALSTSSPLISVGDAVVDLSPSWLKEAAIAAFGLYDKAVLIGGTAAVLIIAAVLLGPAALRRPAAGLGVIGGAALLGAAAVLVRRTDDIAALVPVAAAAAAAAAVLLLLARLRRGARPGGGPGPHADRPAPDRRRFLITGAAVAGGGVLLGAGGLAAAGSGGASRARDALRLPAADVPLPPLPRGVGLGVPGLTPFTTPNRDFYRIDTALTVPRLDPSEWTLRIDGMVDEPLELDYGALLRLPLVEADTTLTCVSNQVGGDLAGNARWLGVRLADLLREAGVQSGADQVLSTSSDGWTCGTPTELVLDGREALLAIGMNGEPLPFRHGFPVRMVTPGIYGFVGSTKWLTRITLTRFADRRSYWAERGWAVRAPIKTMSRIDVPGPLERVEAGPTTVAGVAWAQHRGVDAVEVSVDGGEWAEAQLAEVPGIDTWRQWRTEADLSPGRHTLRVRATDGTGAVQTSERAEPIPDGASGWHSVQVIAE
ncbi:molybdopterin-dependent oxidoreductase [Nocardiopsis sp. CNT-189]|uniref:molybdopterin-dependent oxidoreductase n=1 Tax=Nocardiopsis oceanisediminis TaxID=2816862 RepID=UPI003B33DECE